MIEIMCENSQKSKLLPKCQYDEAVIYLPNCQ